jgi:ribose 5-phosphate isomerase RpiB
MPKLQKKIDLMIGVDHAGLELKESILNYLSAKGIRWEDIGTFSTESVD